MAKINFDDKGRSYIEIKEHEDKIAIILSAEDADNSQNTIVNSVILTREQFLSLSSGVLNKS